VGFQKHAIPKIRYDLVKVALTTGDHDVVNCRFNTTTLLDITFSKSNHYFIGYHLQQITMMMMCLRACVCVRMCVRAIAHSADIVALPAALL
jgi:hypothetical protein